MNDDTKTTSPPRDGLNTQNVVKIVPAESPLTVTPPNQALTTAITQVEPPDTSAVCQEAIGAQGQLSLSI